MARLPGLSLPPSLTVLQAGQRLQDLLGRSADADKHFARALAGAAGDPELDARAARLGLALALNARSEIAQVELSLSLSLSFCVCVCERARARVCVCD